jgi:hypothetical protein
MDIATSIIISVITAGVIAIVAGLATSFLYWERAKAELQKEYERRFNLRRWEAYRSYVKLVTLVSNDRKNFNPDELIGFASELILCGSDDVIQAHNALARLVRRNDPADAGRGEKALMDVLVAMRKDLGYSTNIHTDDLYSLLTIKDTMLGE